MEYRKIITIEFKDFTREVLEKSWEWLNDPLIKRQVFALDFDKETQEKWFESLKTKDDYFIKSMWHNGKPIAVMGIKHLTAKEGEVFGYIGEKEYWGKTVGVQGMDFLIDYGRSIQLESLYAIMLKENLNSYKLHCRMGFKIEKDVDEKTMMMRLSLLRHSL